MLKQRKLSRDIFHIFILGSCINVNPNFIPEKYFYKQEINGGNLQGWELNDQMVILFPKVRRRNSQDLNFGNNLAIDQNSWCC